MASHRVTSPGGDSAQRQDAVRGEVGTELLRTKWVLGVKAKQASQGLLKEVSKCYDFFQSFAPFFKCNYSSSATLCYLLLLIAYMEPTAYVGLDAQTHQR